VIQCNQIKFLVYVALCTTVLFIIHQIKFLLYVALCTAVQTPNFPAKEKKPRSGSITTGINKPMNPISDFIHNQDTAPGVMKSLQFAETPAH
ncbi:unnamed protein product, partial [Heterosigma akashiwo]